MDSIFVSPSSSPTLAPSFSPIKTPTASPIDSMEESIALWSRKDAGDVSAQQGVVISASTNNIGYFDNGGERIVSYFNSELYSFDLFLTLFNSSQTGSLTTVCILEYRLDKLVRFG